MYFISKKQKTFFIIFHMEEFQIIFFILRSGNYFRNVFYFYWVKNVILVSRNWKSRSRRYFRTIYNTLYHLDITENIWERFFKQMKWKIYQQYTLFRQSRYYWHVFISMKWNVFQQSRKRLRYFFISSKQKIDQQCMLYSPRGGNVFHFSNLWKMYQ